MSLIVLLVNWLRTSDPSRKFRAELDLMFWGARNLKWVRKYFQRRIFYKYNCDISHLADIHPSVYFPHPCGVVIGSQAKIKKGCRIYQQVTIGSNFDSDNSMARISEHTYIGSGAKVIGGISIGKNCYVGANAVITKNVADNSSVVGNNKNIKSRKPQIEKEL
ncbi:serine acetyltransferase [Vibrio pelagius]|uniref:Serine acetyltransferase n=1 Tax=Vibrio pelagius TaxID=28169 RepID=A0ABY5G6P2_VIBPE|nr:serine acetyltransferase [Vibrio pelagius]UTT85819.1 serine acetyltransferase [Vibrio pelagius]